MFESLFLYTGSNSRAGKTLKYELTYLFLRGLWLKQITECSFQEKWAIIYRHRGDTWTSTIYRRMNRDTRFTASRHMCRYIAIQPHVVSSKVSRYLGRDTIRVSRSHVSRCIDASMHRYTPNAHIANMHRATLYHMLYILKVHFGAFGMVNLALKFTKK